MPLYAYKCPACNAREVVLAKLDSPAPKCARCACVVREPGSRNAVPQPMEKQITAPAGFDLRGVGVYSKGTH